MVADQPHRWSGWPGAWCLDCGVADPAEESLTCADCNDGFPNDEPTFCKRHRPTACPTPNSRSHDPYGR